MRPFVELISKKRDGLALTDQEIHQFVMGAVQGTIADYQISAMLMAIFCRGMTEDETVCLTREMTLSGRTVDLSALPGPIADKHSTGGVADTTTLILAPLVAACGVPVFKMSGRGLGFSGGTLDKLESIAGFSTQLSVPEAMALCRKSGIVILGQTEDLTPADAIFYALRDVTATVESIPLIVSSIMSKKIAAGTDVLALDVKCGSGAFMKDLDSAQTLARDMAAIGRRLGKRVSAVITSMAQPLGRFIGNSLEVEEAILALRGEVEGDLMEVTYALGEEILVNAGRVSTFQEARQMLKKAVSTGAALKKMCLLIRQQGGDAGVIDDLSLLPHARYAFSVPAPKSGYVGAMHTDQIGLTSVLLGAGRQKKSDRIDPSAGIRMEVRLGDYVRQGAPLCTVFASTDSACHNAVIPLQQAIVLCDKKPALPPLILDRQ
ncbi:MAG TPA: thymidine phosphorylase [Firmicutes bacterium]|nr:thymidine phosphorylase [Bacillota bacterium]